MWRQSRNRRSSATPCFQRPTSDAFHQPHPAAHRTASYPKNPSRLGLRKTFLNGLHDSPAKVFLGFSRQRAGILLFHVRHTTILLSVCHLYSAPISKRPLSIYCDAFPDWILTLHSSIALPDVVTTILSSGLNLTENAM